VTKEKAPLGEATTFLYNGVNKTLRSTPLDQTSFEYDARNRLKEVRYSGHPDDNRTYFYDPAGNLLNVTEPTSEGVRDVSYSYDALNRVLTETSMLETRNIA